MFDKMHVFRFEISDILQLSKTYYGYGSFALLQS